MRTSTWTINPPPIELETGQSKDYHFQTAWIIVTSKAQRGKTQRFQIAGWRWSQKNAPHTFIYNRITIIF